MTNLFRLTDDRDRSCNFHKILYCIKTHSMETLEMIRT